MTEPDPRESPSDQEPEHDELFADEPTPPMPTTRTQRAYTRAGCLPWAALLAGVSLLLVVIRRAR